MQTQKTNMASEFWFFSQLHRLGYDATITLGNTKRVDIYVKLSSDKTLSFDVKGKESFERGDYRLGRPELQKENHFFAFIDLKIRKESNNRIEFDGDPECFIIEANNLENIAVWGKKGEKGSIKLRTDKHAELWLWPKILRLLKFGDKKPKRLINKFKKYWKIEGEIDFEEYKSIIMTIKDFEEKYHELKSKT